MPESRRVVDRNPNLVFQKVNEILVQSSNVPRNPFSKLVQLNASLSKDHVPLKTRKIEDWPSQTECSCLHCGEACVATPLPVVHFFDPIASSYWVSGFFCRPCCALAFINNDSQFNSDRTRCGMWTREVLSNFFNISQIGRAAPPRSALNKYGGPLTLSEFYGEDIHATKFVEIHSAPFVSFAMYAEVMSTSKSNHHQIQKQNLFHGNANEDEEEVRQPKIRTEPIALQEPTGKASLLLDYITRRTNQTSVPTQHDDTEPQKDQAKKMRKNSVNRDDTKKRVLKTVLKKAKKMEMEEAASGNKTRSLLSYAAHKL